MEIKPDIKFSRAKKIKKEAEDKIKSILEKIEQDTSCIVTLETTYVDLDTNDIGDRHKVKVIINL